MALSPKQQRFVDEYAVDQNATQAYKRAGYKVRAGQSARAAGGRLFRTPAIRAAIDVKLSALAEDTNMTAKEAWRESGYIARSDIGDIIDFTGIDPRLKPVNEIPESARRAIKSVKVKRYLEGSGDEARMVEVMEFTFWDKPGALNTRLRALGELKETVEHTGKDGGPVKVEADVNIIDVRKKIVSYVNEIRAAAARNLLEAGENGHTNGEQSTDETGA